MKYHVSLNTVHSPIATEAVTIITCMIKVFMYTAIVRDRS